MSVLNYLLIFLITANNVIVTKNANEKNALSEKFVIQTKLLLRYGNAYVTKHIY
jgi:hypothetical protein